MSVGVGEWFDRARRVLFVHAHPDDETITTGGTLAALAEAGAEPLVVTLTRGEQGEVVAGPLEHLQGTDGLAPHRQAELSAALAMLGVERHVFLGVPPARAEGLSPTIYEDSGMQWLPDGRAGTADAASADALTSVPAVESLTDLLSAAHAAQVGAIVSYDDGGGYGHPDHVHAHRIARAVAVALELPFWQIVPDEAEDAAQLAQSDVEAYDISPWFDRKVAALRAHMTQLAVEVSGEGSDVGAATGRYDIVHVGGQRQPVSRVERFQRVADPGRTA